MKLFLKKLVLLVFLSFYGCTLFYSDVLLFFSPELEVSLTRNYAEGIGIFSSCQINASSPTSGYVNDELKISSEMFTDGLARHVFFNMTQQVDVPSSAFEVSDESSGNAMHSLYDRKSIEYIESEYFASGDQIRLVVNYEVQIEGDSYYCSEILDYTVP